MHINKLEISNVLGIARADIEIPSGILLVAGGNMSGKSSLRDAISMALTGAPCRVTKKKDLDQALHDGAKKGRVTVLNGGDVAGQFTLPKGEHTAPEWKGAEYLPLVLDPAKFASLPNDERRSLLFKITGCNASMKTIEPMAEKHGIDMKLFAEVSTMLRSGFPAAEKYAQDKAREAKGSWKAVTGEQWGSDKAEGWEVTLPAAAAPSDKEIKLAQSHVDLTTKQIGEGQTFLGGLLEQQRAGGSRAERMAALQEKAGGLERAQAKLANTQADLAKWTASADDLHNEIEVARLAANVMECPCCSAKLRLDGSELVPAKTAPAAASLATLQADLQKAVEAMNLLKRTEQNDLVAISACEQAATDLAAEQEAAPEFDAAKIPATEEAIAKLRQRLTTEQAKLAALQGLKADHEGAAETNKKAAAFHAEITNWLAIADAMAADGIPGELLSKALAPINQSLEMLGNMAGWPLVTITRDIEITSAERAYVLCSESEKWRADTLLALAIAQITGLNLVVLDRFDVLELKARGQLVSMLCQLVKLGSMDSIVMLGTMKEIPAGMPPEITSVWVREGIAEVVK